ncbi:hypothetical protein JCM24511_01602 [Saitozyma sp. JCM 24511]|nr:hypothetical protein JCM24511_01602 [Saitozyma sp. JCM 24511]
MTPTFELCPGKSVGPFQLGETLWAIVDVLRSSKTAYPKFELSWDTHSPLLSPVTVHIPHPGLTLFFSHPTQRLSLISIPLPVSGSGLSGLSLTYETHVLSGPNVRLDRAKIGRTLGPTYAGGGGALRYPGVEFGLKGEGGREDAVEKVTVLPKEGREIVGDPIRSCVIQPGRGATLHMPEPYEIIIGQTTGQDLLLDLGPPLRKFWKEDDRMERIWGRADTKLEDGECFWNYFQFGLDFLLSPSGVVLKIIAHSNIPGTPLFQRYARCPWTLPTSTTPLDLASPLSLFRKAFPANTASGRDAQSYLSPSGASAASASTASVSGTVSTSIGESAPDAMILDRTGEAGMDGVIGMGQSRLVGFKGVIVEEDEKTKGICSVLVYK